MLENAKSSRLDTRRKVDILELANRTPRSERDNIQSAAEAKEVILEESIRDLGKKNSRLLARASTTEAENTRLLEQISTAEVESVRMAERPFYISCL